MLQWRRDKSKEKHGSSEKNASFSTAVKAGSDFLYSISRKTIQALVF